MANLAKTFGLTEPRLRAIYREFIARNFETERKERRDKGETIFNSDKKRKSTFTALNMYKKQRVRQFRDDPSKLDGLALKAEYNALSADEKFTYQVIADAQLACSPYLHDEIIDLFKKKWHNNMG